MNYKTDYFSNTHTRKLSLLALAKSYLALTIFGLFAIGFSNDGNAKTCQSTIAPELSAESNPIVKPITRNKNSIVNAIATLLTVNSEKNKVFRRILKSHSLSPIYNSNGSLRKKFKFVSYNSMKEFREARAERSFWDRRKLENSIFFVSVKTERGELTLVRIFDETPHQVQLNIVVNGDWIFFESEYPFTLGGYDPINPPKGPFDSRDQNTFAIRIDEKGNLIEIKSKTDYLLDQYPFDDVVITRTMSLREKNFWLKAKNPDGNKLGSELMKEALGADYKPMSMATGGYWNDNLDWWVEEIEFSVPKEKIRSWVKRRLAYVTPLGLGYFTVINPARPQVESDILIPFEVASISPKLNTELIEIYRQSVIKPSQRLNTYRHIANSHSITNLPLGLLDHSESRLGKYIHTTYGYSFPEEEAQPLSLELKRIKQINDANIRLAATIEASKIFLKLADKHGVQNENKVDLEKLRKWIYEQDTD